MSGHHPQYRYSFHKAINNPTSTLIYTRAYGGTLPSYPDVGMDIWIEKPGYVAMVMHGQQPPPPRNNYEVTVRFDITPEDNFSFESDSENDIVYQLALKGIPVSKLLWAY